MARLKVALHYQLQLTLVEISAIALCAASLKKQKNCGLIWALVLPRVQNICGVSAKLVNLPNYVEVVAVGLHTSFLTNEVTIPIAIIVPSLNKNKVSANECFSNVVL